ncbi:hypothetical protein LOZ12_004380 [Ophidiomyces ophidiicola]
MPKNKSSDSPPRYSKLPPQGHASSSNDAGPSSANIPTQDTSIQRGPEIPPNNDFLDDPPLPNPRPNRNRRPQPGRSAGSNPFDTDGAYDHEDSTSADLQLAAVRHVVRPPTSDSDSESSTSSLIAPSEAILYVSAMAAGQNYARLYDTPGRIIVVHALPVFVEDMQAILARRVLSVNGLRGRVNHRFYLSTEMIGAIAESLDCCYGLVTRWTREHGILLDFRGDVWLDPWHLPPGVEGALRRLFHMHRVLVR